jgi:hypothetical protein
MARLKNFKNNINIFDQKIGPEQRQALLDEIAKKGTLLPKGLLEEDMDKAFIDFFKSDERMSISLGGKAVPVILLTIQRWSEFTKTWKFTDEFKDVQMPFITIVRKPDIQQGQNQAGLWNIAGKQTYTYIKNPTFDGKRMGVDLYKIPQPTSIDITYEVRLFTGRMRDLNRFNRKIQKAFQSRQCYITANGHPIPLHLESIGDESNIENFETKRFYVQNYEIKMLGYLLDDEDFEVIPTINRTITTFEVEEKQIINESIFEPIKNGNVVNYVFVWQPKSSLSFSFRAKYDVVLNQLVNVENISRIIIKRNGTSIFDGTVLTSSLVFIANDDIEVKVYKNSLTLGKFTLIGNTI